MVTYKRTYYEGNAAASSSTKCETATCYPTLADATLVVAFPSPYLGIEQRLHAQQQLTNGRHSTASMQPNLVDRPRVYMHVWCGTMRPALLAIYHACTRHYVI
jgi:hypothetical protein